MRQTNRACLAITFTQPYSFRLSSEPIILCTAYQRCRLSILHLILSSLIVVFIMKLLGALVVGLSTSTYAFSIFRPLQAVFGAGAGAEDDLYLVELSPGETRWIEEDEKWALRRVCAHVISDQGLKL